MPRRPPSEQAPVLAVASTGGHLDELHRLLPRMGIDGAGVEWATFDTEHSRSLLAGQSVHYVRLTRTRDALALAANVGRAARMLRPGRYRAVVSTGAGVALAFLPLARALGIPAHYVEVATRLDGPSVTGRVLGHVPGVRTYTQIPAWADERWLYRGSVFDAYGGEVRREAPGVRRVVVTVGQNPYGFRRLLERALAILPPGADVLWQTGVTDVAGLPIRARASVPQRELVAAIEAADVVVAHAGTGSALSAIDAGLMPVLVPRRAAHREQIDDHQVAFAAQLAERGLARSVAVEEMTLDVLRDAAAHRVVRREAPPPFELA